MPIFLYIFFCAVATAANNDEYNNIDEEHLRTDCEVTPFTFEAARVRPN